MEIIKHGTPPSEKEYTVTCGGCSTVFKFQENEGTFVVDRLLTGTECKTGKALKINCPVCSKLCFIYDV